METCIWSKINLLTKNRTSRNPGSRHHLPNKNRATTCETSRAHHSCRAAEPARHNRSALGRGERNRHWPSVDDQRANAANRQRHVANDILASCGSQLDCEIPREPPLLFSPFAMLYERVWNILIYKKNISHVACAAYCTCVYMHALAAQT